MKQEKEVGKLELSELSEKVSDSVSMATMDVKELLDALEVDGHDGAVTAWQVYGNMRATEIILAALHRFVKGK